MPMLSGNSKLSFITRQHASAVILLSIFTILCLIPFVNKGFHIDDTLFLWNARQIQYNPGDFYGFRVNWYGWEMPMHQVTKNPPLTSYYIAAVAFLFGWSEIVLHLAFLLPAVGVASGSYFLAKRFCSQPFLAACAGIVTPVFLVSSTNVMCDTMMLAFWVWALFLWMEGLEKNKPFILFISSVIVSLCVVTKYFGISLIPLFAIYSLCKKRKPGAWALFLLIPVSVLAGYQWATSALYGRGLLLDAASYATELRTYKVREFIEKMLTGLAFSGGCIAMVIFYLHLLWSRKFLLALFVVTSVSILLLPHLETIGIFPLVQNNDIRWFTVIQIGIFAMTGATILALTIADLLKNKDADSFVLFLWISGTFIFSSFINWTVNGRSILPMVPAVGILMARRIEQRAMNSPVPRLWCLVWPLIPAALLSLLVTWADYRFADSARQAAGEINSTYKRITLNRWFQGHWGFQYYMEKGGGKAVDMGQSKLHTGDIMVVPSNNTNTFLLLERHFRPVQTITLKSFPWLATMSPNIGAGFYADIWGPLPFAIGAVPPEKYTVYLFNLVR
jgi:4-amino-4-deoxy-L-arabinose transferase-like glycosyltransferase